MLRAIMEGTMEPVGRLAYLACEFPVLTPTFTVAGVAGRAGGFRELLPGAALASRLRGRRIHVHARFADAASTAARVAARPPGKSFSVTNHTSCNPYLLGGKLRLKKGHHILIRAAGILRDREIPFRLDVVGDGPGRVRLRVLVRELDLGGRVGCAEAAGKTIGERHDVRHSVRRLAGELREVLA